jgi:hypothetical protein
MKVLFDLLCMPATMNFLICPSREVFELGVFIVSFCTYLFRFSPLRESFDLRVFVVCFCISDLSAVVNAFFILQQSLL